MIIIKLLLIAILLYFFSKSYGLLVSKIFKLKNEVSLAIGYILNITIFTLCIFIPMYFKMSYIALNIFGTIYFILSLGMCAYAIKEKKLLSFTKKEILSILIALLFTILFAIFIDFGNIEMYDSYFYSILTNSASNADKLATINPYNGVGDLQNIYKYLGYYYQSSYFANIFMIKPAYLVLIWPFTFMNYFLLSITALGIVRISKKEWINNIISIFILTLYTSFFRAPFNALHIVNNVIPIYMLYFIFDSFKNKKSLWIYYILFIGAAAGSSTILYTSATCVLVFYIINSIKKNGNFKNVFFIAIPTYLLAVVYLLEASRSLSLFFIYILVLVVIYFLLKLKVVRGIVRYIGISLIVIIPTLFILASKVDNISDYAMKFMAQGEVSDKMATSSSNPKSCITGNVEVNDVGLNINNNRYGSAMKYIYENSNSLFNTTLIMVTHSMFMYGGMLFFFVYSVIKKRKEPKFIGFIIYVIFFFNPFVTKGLAILTLDLNARIYLYFNTFFAIYGIKYFFEYVESLNKEKINKLLKVAYIPYACLLCISILSYVLLLKKINWNNTNLLYKVPNNIVKASDEINKKIKSGKKKPNVLYTADVYNLSMIDKSPNNKYKSIDSKEYKSYYFTPNIINNKMLVNLYFESNGQKTMDFVLDNMIKKEGKINKNNCEINHMLKDYNIKYIVINKSNKDSYKLISNDYDIIYNKNDIILLERK